MKKIRFIRNIFAIAALACGLAGAAQAQATRTWVSGVGDDANPCSRTAPCKTFAGAISKTAAGGEIDVLDPGGFGAVTITKAITIDGGGHVAGVLVSGTNAIVIAASVNDVVTLRNLDINGVNGAGVNGIQVNSAKSVHIEHCEIYGFSQKAINHNLTVTPVGAARLFVNDCFIRANGSGVAVSGVAGGTDAFIDHCRIEGNAGFGVSATNTNAINVLHSQVNRNIGEAVKVDAGASAFVTGCVLNGNLTGALNNGSQFLLMDTTIINNGTGVSGSITTFGNNNVRNNGGGNSLPAPVGQQ